MTKSSSSRIRFFRAPTALIAVLALALLLPTGNAAEAASLAGSATFGALQASGATAIATAAADVVSLWPEENTTADQSWKLVAAAATVNWTINRTQSFGSRPDNESQALFGVKAEGESGDDYFETPRIDLQPLSASVNFLIVANEASVRLSVVDPGSLALEPSAGEVWRGGKGGRAEDAVSHGAPGESYTLTAGVPRGQIETAQLIELRGNFSMYVWAAMVNVTDENGTIRHYQTGEWDSNVVGGQAVNRGVTRQVNSQVVRLDVLQGSLSLLDWDGPGRFSAPEVLAAVEGELVFREARAYFESQKHFFQANNESVAISGNLSVSVRANPASSSQLMAEIEGVDVHTSLPPSGLMPVPGTGRVAAGDRGVSPNAGPVLPVPTADWSLLHVVGWAAASVIVTSSAWLVWRRRAASPRTAASGTGIGQSGSDERDALFLRAEEALILGESAKARAWVEPVLQQDRLNVDAWFIHGASLLQEGAHRRAVRDLEPVVKKIPKNREGLAFLLCLGYVKLGQWARARRWSLVAATDPEFRLQLDHDETFARLRPPPARSSAAAGPTGGRAEFVDVAYG